VIFSGVFAKISGQTYEKWLLRLNHKNANPILELGECHDTNLSLIIRDSFRAAESGFRLELKQKNFPLTS